MSKVFSFPKVFLTFLFLFPSSYLWAQDHSRNENSIFAKLFQKFISIAMSESSRALEISEVSNSIEKILNLGRLSELANIG